MILGVGCDIVEIARLKDRSDELALRLLSKQEYELYSNYPNKRKLSFLAGRFAAKEAIFKALPIEMKLQDIEILSTVNKLVCFIKGYKIHISISHEHEYATAYAICEEVM